MTADINSRKKKGGREEHVSIAEYLPRFVAKDICRQGFQ